MTIPRQNEPGWDEWRRTGIGASEMPTLVGENPYQSEYELALLKRGELAVEENDAMRWGHLVEPLGLREYHEATGHRVRNVHTTTVCKTHPHVFASLDGRRIGERVGVEVKLSRWDELPRRVEIQCQGQMAVCDLEAIDVVRMQPYREPLIVTVERDETMGEALLELSEGWYRRYVIGDEMPPIDGSRGASRALDRIHGEPEMVADGEQADLVRQLRTVRQRTKVDEGLERLIVNRLKDSMAGAEALVGAGFRITWRPTNPRRTTDWQAVATDLAPEGSEAWQAAVARHTQEKDGSRPFRLQMEEES